MCYENDLYTARGERFNALIRQGEAQSQEAAELFYYLNRTGYNGLCRFNRRDEFNVPFGKYKTVYYTTDFSAYCEKLKPWRFQVGGVEQLADDTGAFIFARTPHDDSVVQY